ncbi:MAG TPA: DUF423 domain-containing protein [Edaphocola sp.]|nr:DUF423 domain-containing protein [Edaphocola sp.]
MNKKAIVAAAIFGMLAVILGAFGAHALKEKLTPELLNTFETGVKYQMYHAITLLGLGILSIVHPSKWANRAALMFIIGILLFSGSIYALVALKHSGSVGLSGLGIITPIGGMFLVLGWLMILLAAFEKKK